MARIAVILAAGTGSRMGSVTPKQFMEVEGKPLLYWSLKAFSDSRTDHIVIVTGLDDIDYVDREIVEKYGFDKVCDIAAGGSERYESVYRGLLAAEGAGAEDEDIVYIHDCARAMIEPAMIDRIGDETEKCGACCPAVPVKDTIRYILEDDIAGDNLDRSRLRAMQTPQTFRFDIALPAYEKLMEEGRDRSGITDDVMVVDAMLGIKTRLVEGDIRNIKVTTPEDLAAAGVLLRKK